MAIPWVGEETTAGGTVEIGWSRLCRLWLWRRLAATSSVLWPVTDQQNWVELQASRAVLQVSVPIGAVVEGVAVLRVREEAVARAVEAGCWRASGGGWLWLGGSGRLGRDWLRCGGFHIWNRSVQHVRSNFVKFYTKGMDIGQRLRGEG